MSFMFNPFPYDDYTAVNIPRGADFHHAKVIEGNQAVAKTLTKHILQKMEQQKGVVVGIDGYITAAFSELVTLIARNIQQSAKLTVKLIPIDSLYKESAVLEETFSPYLPEDTEEDPVLLFGKLFEGDASVFFDKSLVKQCFRTLSSKPEKTITLVYGNFATYEDLRNVFDLIAYIDVIPKNVVLRFKAGACRNIGDEEIRSYRNTMRRAYYIDLEVAMKHRSDLVKQNLVDWYIIGNDNENMQLVDWDTIRQACDALVLQPFRCKPVYNEGVWGGFYTIRNRNLPKEMRNCAWVFDLIPSEVSLLIQIRDTIIDIPFYTFIRMESLPLLGKESVERFGEYFPIRFNYDDTMRSSGNMSIQVHPGEQYCRENFNELGRQDESYYIVAAGQNAKTYCGFKDGASFQNFIIAIKNSEVAGTPVDYDSYVNAEPSVPGKQFLLPAGTIHASGRNQLVLEIGSLTVGSYTFKLYDYLRKDLDGTQRPIHSIQGERVLRSERTGSWIRNELLHAPREIESGEGWKEFIVGEHNLLYFSLRRIEFLHQALQDTAGKFHVLCLVDGESVRVVSEQNPSLEYVMNYLDIIIVPAGLGKYRIENLGNQPISIHKTVLK